MTPLFRAVPALEPLAQVAEEAAAVGAVDKPVVVGQGDAAAFQADVGKAAELRGVARPLDRDPARLAAACLGALLEAGDAKDAKRTIDCKMLDAMRFSPDRIDAKLGETLRFTASNDGRVLHEFVIGTKEENAAHYQLMKKFANMEHDEPWMAHVAAGGKSEIVWTFNRVGEFEFACLIAGHYEAGMVGKIVVSA